MNPLTALRNWIFKPKPSPFDVMRATWITMPRISHIVRRPDGTYYFYVHHSAEWCRYCGNVTDFDNPDLHDEIPDSFGEI